MILGSVGGEARDDAVLFDSHTGHVVWRVPLPAGRTVNDQAVAPDGTIWVATSAIAQDGAEAECASTLEHWTAQAAHASQTIRVTGRVQWLSVSPRGQLALSVKVLSGGVCRRPEIQVTSVANEAAARVWTGDPSAVSIGPLSWSPAGTQLAFALTPCCGGGTDGIHVLDTTKPGNAYGGAKIIDQFVGGCAASVAADWLDERSLVVGLMCPAPEGSRLVQVSVSSGHRESDLAVLSEQEPNQPQAGPAIAFADVTRQHFIAQDTDDSTRHTVLRVDDGMISKVKLAEPILSPPRW